MMYDLNAPKTVAQIIGREITVNLSDGPLDVMKVLSDAAALMQATGIPDINGRVIHVAMSESIFDQFWEERLRAAKSMTEFQGIKMEDGVREFMLNHAEFTFIGYRLRQDSFISFLGLPITVYVTSNEIEELREQMRKDQSA